jgi:hypothetical protein
MGEIVFHLDGVEFKEDSKVFKTKQDVLEFFHYLEASTKYKFERFEECSRESFLLAQKRLI